MLDSFIHSLYGDGNGFSKSYDTRYIFGTGTTFSFLCATVNKRTKFQALANIQETDSFWSVEFMSAGTQHIDMKFINIDRNLTKCLNRIGME